MCNPDTSICTGGQVWNYCGKPEECTPTCTQRMPKCTESCTLRCECPPQMVLHESQCVPITECPGEREYSTRWWPKFVASELKDPICHSDECQIGSFSSEATKCWSAITMITTPKYLCINYEYFFGNYAIFEYLCYECAHGLKNESNERWSASCS